MGKDEIGADLHRAMNALRERRPNSMPLGFFSSPFSDKVHLWSACPDDEREFVFAITCVENGLTHELGFDAPVSQLIKIMCADAMKKFAEVQKDAKR